MTQTYIQFENLQKFADAALIEASKSTRNINFLVTGELSVKSLRNFPLSDMTRKAEMWQALEVPSELFMNHGQYIGGQGISHISEELRRKASSNRALYSLINQNDVIDSGDKPIPSFMVFQCGIDQNVLYCTSYFRALEVATFLRINLEEIRINLIKILDDLRNHDIQTVRLSIFAFSAYAKSAQIPLERPKLDLLDRMAINDLYEENPSEIAKHLDEKAAETTIVEMSGLEAIKSWLDPKRKEKWPKTLSNVPGITRAVDRAIAAAKTLESMRRSSSHHPNLEEVAKQYVDSIKALAEEFRK